MNWFFIASGAVAAFIAIGHVRPGGKLFLEPMLASDTAEIPKAVLHSVWHMVTITCTVGAISLLVSGFGLVGEGSGPLVACVSTIFAGISVCHLSVGFLRGVPRFPVEMFPWVLFATSAALGFAGLAF